MAGRFPVMKEVMENKRERGGFLRKVVQAVVVMIKIRTQTQDGARALFFSQTFRLLT